MAAVILLAGCNDAKQIATEVLKSKNQRDAESLCTKAIANAEGKRTAGFKAILPGPVDSTKLRDGRFLVTVFYKKMTIDDPGDDSRDLSMFGKATCDVNNGVIVDGTLDAH